MWLSEVLSTAVDDVTKVLQVKKKRVGGGEGSEGEAIWTN